MRNEPPISESPEIARTGNRRLARDVRAALTADRPSLPSRYFYDDRGSRLFEQITQLPEYYQTRTEARILDAHAADIIAAARPAELVELGSGVGEKIRSMLDAWIAASAEPGRCVLFDINRAVVRSSAARLSAEYPGLSVEGIVGEFPQDLPMLGLRPRRLAMLLGGTIGNIAPDDLPGFLTRMARVLEPEGAFLVGLDLVKDVRRLEAAYNDARGLTADFNLNLLRVMNLSLDADFDLDAFEHVAFYDAEHEWIEMRLRSLRRQRVNLPAIDLTLELDAGQEIRTEISCKYTRDSLERRLAGTNLDLGEWYADGREDFALALLRRAV